MPFMSSLAREKVTMSQITYINSVKQRKRKLDFIWLTKSSASYQVLRVQTPERYMD